MKRTLGTLALGMFLLAATPTSFGGWAVVTFSDIPEYLVLNEPTTLTFKIRQHGQTLVNDRSPSVSLQDSNGGFFSRLLSRGSFPATRTTEDGAYQVTVTPTDGGEVTLVVDTDVHGWKSRLLPLQVRQSQGDGHPLSLEERGRQLFAAKGCATCHAKLDDPALEDIRLIRVGPDLTERSFPEEWLAAKIRNPTQFEVPSATDRMPVLGVSEPHIAALVRYINGDRTATDSQ